MASRNYSRKLNLTFLPFICELVFAQEIVKHPWMVSIFPKLVAHLPSTIYLGYRIRRHHGPKNHLLCPKLAGITHLDICHVGKTILTDVVRCISSFSALHAVKLWMHTWGEIALRESETFHHPAIARSELRPPRGISPLDPCEQPCYIRPGFVFLPTLAWHASPASLRLITIRRSTSTASVPLWPH
ncbi:hypothetical protein K438DRAFT_530687 [Mycena galopus ATCC 62051]|nr:hypothetical protein K438DRAFT_530687 [Mycena galopus ATCC 62051]